MYSISLINQAVLKARKVADSFSTAVPLNPHQHEVDMKLKRMVSFVIILVFQFVVSYTMAESLSVISNQVPEEWVETIETPKGSVDISVTIETPMVDAMPIIKTGISNVSMVSDEIVQYYENQEHTFSPFSCRNDEYSFSFVLNNTHRPKEKSKNEVGWESSVLDLNHLDWNTTFAQDNPISLSDAWEIMSQEVMRCYGLNAATDLMIDNITLEGRLSEYNKKTGEILGYIGDVGRYVFDCRQAFRGVPLLGNASMGFVKSLKSDSIFGERLCVVGYIASGDSFTFRYSLTKEVELVAEDVPLASFSEIRNVIVDLVKAGNVRDIFTLRLGYVQFLDADDKNVFWCIPCWVVESAYYSSSKAKTKEYEGFSYKSRADYQMLIINAQTGKLIDPLSTNKSRNFCPEIVY